MIGHGGEKPCLTISANCLVEHREEKSRMKTLIKLLFISLTVTAPALIANAQDNKKQGNEKSQTEKTEGKFLGKGDGVETCPVTGEKILNKDVKADFYGRTIYFCCAGCVEDVKQNPAAYIKKTHKEQLAAIKDLPKSEDGHHGHHATAKEGEEKDGQQFLGKGDGVETCPVTGEPVNKNLKSEADGQVFYVCCEGCIETVKKSPALYLKKAKQ